MGVPDERVPQTRVRGNELMSQYWYRYAPLFPILDDGGGAIAHVARWSLPLVFVWRLDIVDCGVFAVELRCHVIMLQRICCIAF